VALLGLGTQTLKWAPPARATASKAPRAIAIRLRAFMLPPPSFLASPQMGMRGSYYRPRVHRATSGTSSYN